MSFLILSRTYNNLLLKVRYWRTIGSVKSCAVSEVDLDKYNLELFRLMLMLSGFENLPALGLRFGNFECMCLAGLNRYVLGLKGRGVVNQLNSSVP